MNQITGNEPAAPSTYKLPYEESIYNYPETFVSVPGLTIRQQFAATFTAAYIATGKTDHIEACRRGVSLADNLIIELNKPKADGKER